MAAFERNEVITEYVNRLMALCEPLKRGDLLARAQVAEALECEPHQDHWRQCVRKLKRRLEDERSISLWPEPGMGYRLLTKQEQLTMLPAAWSRRANRCLSRARRSVGCIPDSQLTMHLRRVRDAQLEGVARARLAVASHVRRQVALCRPYQGNPRAVPEPANG